MSNYSKYKASKKSNAIFGASITTVKSSPKSNIMTLLTVPYTQQNLQKNVEGIQK